MGMLMGNQAIDETSLRVGAVSFLNTKPLVDYLPQEIQASMILDLPSRLADSLCSGRLDVALVPVIEVFRNPELVIVPDSCIACVGPVWSVKLFSRVRWEQVETLSLDEGSRTSAALCRILLAKRYNVRPGLRPLAIDQDWTKADSDAVLVIGDRAMDAASEDFPFSWDLGEQWSQWTGKPFVFAAWATPADCLKKCATQLQQLREVLNQSRDRGLENVDELAKRYFKRYGLSQEACLKYFQQYLHFRLGMAEKQGLDYFHQLAAELDLAPKQRELIYHEC